VSKEISPGDLVMIVSVMQCGHGERALGKVFTVKRVWRDRLQCPVCGNIEPIQNISGNTDSMRAGFSFARLKKIDPPAETEEHKTTEELTV